MRVLFDHQIMDAQVRGGVSRYFFHLASTLEQQGLATVRLPRIFTDNEYFRALLAESGRQRSDLRSRLIRTLRSAGLAPREVERAWRRAKSGLNRRASVEALKEQDFDLFHPTYYDPYFLDHLRGRPFVLTIYDMIHEIYPEYFRPGDRTSERKAILARAAAKIIALSSSTKSDIVKYLDVDPQKIEVIYLAGPLSSESERLSVPEDYVLYVGDRGRYKNFATFLRAFAGIASARPGLHLVCVHRTAFDRAELVLIRELGLEGRCVSVPANDRQLTFLYRNAALFAYPSLYEGFGLPVLEAFAAGCPVVLGRTSSLPEVAGDAAVYCDPSDALSIEAALATALRDGDLRRTLIRRGRERLAAFSWITTAERTASLYESCLAGR